MLVANEVNYGQQGQQTIHDHLYRRMIEKENCCADEDGPSVEKDQYVNELVFCFFVRILSCVKCTILLFGLFML